MIPKAKYEKIIQMISEGYAYKDIAKKIKVAYTTICNISIKNGMRINTRYDKEEAIKIIESIHLDIKNGISYKELLTKHDLTNKKKLHTLYRFGLEPITQIYKPIRDDKIKELYKVKLAREVVSSEDKELNNPERIVTPHYVYIINREVGGERKFPKIGSRFHGGNFEDKTILKYIQKKRDKDNWTFKQIADKLNAMGKKTVMGVNFSDYLVRYKYLHYNKVKGKKKII